MLSKALAIATPKTLHSNSRASFSLLKKRLSELIPEKKAELKELSQKYGNREIGKVTVDQIIGGMRGIPGLLWEFSALDSQTGIRFRGHTFVEATEKLPKAPNGEEPLPEAFIWFLLTGEFPTEEQFRDISAEILANSEVPADIEAFIKKLPKDMHPMTQLSLAILRLQPTSKFAKAYAQGIHKAKYWEPVYDDFISLIAKLPRLAALIYRNTFKDGKYIDADKNLDWGANFAHMLGYDSFEVYEAIRGYLSIHSDHEGYNVSSHATHLVGSALADPFLSYSAGVNGLAGPLHGLANQEVLKWILNMRDELGDNLSEEAVAEFTKKTISVGRVIPGYGHAVLRAVDPRYLHLKNFAKKFIKNDPLINLTWTIFKVVPPILKAGGKVKNPYPNVDAHSGVILYHYGLTEYNYYTVLFAVSRAIGAAGSLIWSRGFGLPIERPGSIDMDWIRQKFESEYQ